MPLRRLNDFRTSGDSPTPWSGVFSPEALARIERRRRQLIARSRAIQAGFAAPVEEVPTPEGWVDVGAWAHPPFNRKRPDDRKTWYTLLEWDAARCPFGGTAFRRS